MFFNSQQTHLAHSVSMLILNHKRTPSRHPAGDTSNSSQSAAVAGRHSPSTTFSPPRHNEAATWRSSEFPSSLRSQTDIKRLIKGAVAGSRWAPPRSVCDNNALWEGGGNKLTSDLNLIVVITEAMTPLHGPPACPHPPDSLTERCCRKRQPQASATSSLETVSAAPHSNPPQRSSSAAGNSVGGDGNWWKLIINIWLPGKYTWIHQRQHRSSANGLAGCGCPVSTPDFNKELISCLISSSFIKWLLTLQEQRDSRRSLREVNVNKQLQLWQRGKQQQKCPLSF